MGKIALTSSDCFEDEMMCTCVTLSPLRSGCQHGIKCARILGGIPVKDTREGAREDQEGQRRQAYKSDP